MRWATVGSGFDDIITDEFLKTEPLPAQMLYLCVCLATAAQFTFIEGADTGVFFCNPAATLAYLKSNLQDIVVPYTGR
jgi:hypothetical protein